MNQLNLANLVSDIVLGTGFTPYVTAFLKRSHYSPKQNEFIALMVSLIFGVFSYLQAGGTFHDLTSTSTAGAVVIFIFGASKTFYKRLGVVSPFLKPFMRGDDPATTTDEATGILSSGTGQTAAALALPLAAGTLSDHVASAQAVVDSAKTVHDAAAKVFAAAGDVTKAAQSVAATLNKTIPADQSLDQKKLLEGIQAKAQTVIEEKSPLEAIGGIAADEDDTAEDQPEEKQAETETVVAVPVPVKEAAAAVVQDATFLKSALTTIEGSGVNQ